jgi:hypothetical protein
MHSKDSCLKQNLNSRGLNFLFKMNQKEWILLKMKFFSALQSKDGWMTCKYWICRWFEVTFAWMIANKSNLSVQLIIKWWMVQFLSFLIKLTIFNPIMHQMKISKLKSFNIQNKSIASNNLFIESSRRKISLKVWAYR